MQHMYDNMLDCWADMLYIFSYFCSFMAGLKVIEWLICVRILFLANLQKTPNSNYKESIFCSSYGIQYSFKSSEKKDDVQKCYIFMYLEKEFILSTY